MNCADKLWSKSTVVKSEKKPTKIMQYTADTVSVNDISRATAGEKVIYTDNACVCACVHMRL